VVEIDASAGAPGTAVEEKLNFKKILPVFVIVLIDLLGLTIIIPLLPLYAASFGADPFLIGLLGAAYPVTQFVGAPLLGRLSDRYGRKPILLFSQVGTFIGFLVLGFANALWILFLARVIDGLSGANISTAQAVIADSTNEKTRTQGLGLVGAAFGLGFIIGPVIAFLALAASGQNYRVPAFVAAGFSLASILLTWLWLSETRSVDSTSEYHAGSALSLSKMFAALSHPAVGLLLVLIFVQQIAFGGFEQLLSLFTLNRLGLNASGNAVIFVFVGLIVVAVQGGLIGPWSRKLGDRRLIYLGLVTLAVGLSLVAFTPRQPPPWYSRAELTAELTAPSALPGETPPTQDILIGLPGDQHTGWAGLAWILLAMVPVSIGGGVLQPSLNSLITKRIHADEVGGMLGISAAFLSGANAFAPLIGGAIFQAFGSTYPFLLAGVLMGGLWLGALHWIKPGREENTPAELARSASVH
jgi:DHA1 family tetracycline resistance protein-like MFS transporter